MVKIEERKKMLFLLPSLAGVIVFQILPMLHTFWYSFSGPPENDWGLENYTSLLRDPLVKIAFFNTVKLVVGCFMPIVTLSLIAAYLIWLKGKKAQKIILVFLMPFFIPNASLHFVWKLIFDKAGVFSKWYSYFSGESIHFWNGASSFALLCGIYIWKNIGIYILIWYLGIAKVKKEQIESARVCGANEFQVATQIVLPNIAPTVFLISCYSLISIFDIYNLAYTLVGNHPVKEMYMPGNLFNKLFANLEYGKLSALGFLLILFFMVCMVLFYRLWGKRHLYE